MSGFYMDSSSNCNATVTPYLNCSTGSITNTIFNCSACDRGYYLHIGRCHVVPLANVNCSNGSMSGSIFTCSECLDGSFLAST